MRDITLGETIYPKFTTRAFATGVPTVLAGTPVVSVYENDNLTQITAGVTLGVDHDGVVGLNLVTVVATGGNGFEAGKEYQLVITTGTVGSVSVVGEVVYEFTVDSSAALKAVDLLNDVAATDIVTAGAITTSSGAVSNVTLTATATALTDVINAASIVASVSGNVDGSVASVTAAVGITAAAVDLVWDETLAGHVTADTTGLLLNDWQNGGRLDLILDIIAVDTTTDIPALIATAQADLDIITGAAGALLDSTATSAQLVDDVWDEVLTGGTHNVTNSSGRRLRQLQEAGSYNGRVWLDTVNGTAGTTNFENGTDTNQVDSIADTNTLLTALGLSIVEVAPGSSITFAATQADQFFVGENWTLALGGQSISGASICGANITGICTGVVAPRFETCTFGNATVPPCRVNGGSGLEGTLTLGSAGDLDLINCVSLVSGASGPTVDMGAGTGASNLSVKHWSGAITVINIEAGDVVTIEGVGGLVNINGTGGSVDIRGIFEDVIDSSSAAVAIDQSAMLNRRSLNIYPDGIVLDTGSANTGVVPYSDGTNDNPANTLANARTIGNGVGEGLNEFFLTRGSSITLDAAFVATSFGGTGGVVALNGQSVTACSFFQQFVSGVGVGTSTVFFADSALSGVTINAMSAVRCSFAGTLTMAEAAEYKLLRECFSSTSAADPVFNFGAIGDQRLTAIGYRGNMVLDNVGNTGTDEVNIYGVGKITINASCTGGVINIFGTGHVVVNNGTSTVNLDTNTDNIAAILLDTDTTLPALIGSTSVTKNATFSNFEFLMVASAGGAPLTGLTVTGERSIDGAAFAGVTGTIAEVSDGIYQFDAVAADTNGDVITWKFSAATAEDTFVTFTTVS